MIDRIKAALSSPRFNAFISRRTNQWIILGVLVVLWVCMVGGFFLLISHSAPEPVIAGEPTAESELPAAAVRTSAPTPACIRPVLTLGPTSYTIESVPRQADGSFALPVDGQGSAFWIEGPPGSYVFGMNPHPANLALRSALRSGDPLHITWADCSEEAYVVQSVDALPADMSALFDPPAAGIYVFVTSGPGQEGFVVRGVRPEKPAGQSPAAEEQGGTRASVEFLETTLSADGTRLLMALALSNQGDTPIRLAVEDISLAAVDAGPQRPTSTQPALPLEIAPGEQATISLVFTNPPAGVGIFRLLDFTLDLYY